MNAIDTNTIHTMTDRRGTVRYYRLTVTGAWCWCSAPQDVLGGYLVITGDTYDYREDFKTLGLRWDRSGKCWSGTPARLSSWSATAVRNGLKSGELVNGSSPNARPVSLPVARDYDQSDFSGYYN